LLWDGEYEKYEKQYNSLKYMGDLSEDTLWILYEQALDQPTNHPFEDFT